MRFVAICLLIPLSLSASTPKKPTPKALPEAHNGQPYSTHLAGIGPLWPPTTCNATGKPLWMTFDCGTWTLSGTPTETAPAKYTIHLTVTNSDKSVLQYVLTLAVINGAEDVPVGKAVATTAKPVTAPTPVTLSPVVKLSSAVNEGTTSITGTVIGVPPGTAGLSIELWIKPTDGQAYRATLKPAANTTAALERTPVDTEGNFTVSPSSPLPNDAVVSLVVVGPGGVTIKQSADANPMPAILPSIPMPAIKLTNTPVAGSNTITGFVTPLAKPVVVPDATTTPPIVGNVPLVFVEVMDPVNDRVKYRAPLQATASTTVLQTPVDASGNFSLLLKNNFVPGEKVTVKVIPPAGHKFADTMVTELATNEITVKSGLQIAEPTINTQLREGATTIGGTATITNASAGAINVSFLRDDDPTMTPEMPITGCFTLDKLTAPPGTHFMNLTPATGTSALYATVDATAGTFKATLTDALREGDRIRVVQVFASGTLPEESEKSKCNGDPQLVRFDFDWYRTAITFTAGVLLSNSSSNSQASANFAQANQFYALNVDRTWREPGSPQGDRWSSSYFPGFATYFETRLTSIPVSSTAATTTSTTTTGTTSTATTTPAFLTSQKTVRVGTGAYFPWVVKHGAGTHPNGIFFAPIAKVGFDTLTGAAQQTNTLVSGSVQTLNYQSAYNFFSFGGRVGHLRLPGSKERAPLIDDYLDITVGRFSNLQSFICHTGPITNPQTGPFTNTSCLADYPSLYAPPNAAPLGVVDSRKSLYRVDLEGLVRIPIPASAIPFYVGFNANIAQHTLGSAHLDHAYAPPDDIRIFFGTKIDIGTFLSKFGLGAN